jgi:predicted DNA-binding transcriptional regulator YafY
MEGFQAVDTAERLLGLLSLLQRRTHWPAEELAERLGITTRTVRRDVTRLRAYGYPVEAFAGHGGGYQLGRGSHLPPLLLDDDETLAVALGLSLVGYAAVDGLNDAATAAVTKIHQLLPAHLRTRLDALETVTFTGFADRGARHDGKTFATLTRAASTHVTATFDYVDHHGVASQRHVEPTQLVRTQHHWYVVAFDLDRFDWRTFRLDRIGRPELTSQRCAERTGPDPREFVERRLPDDRFAHQASIFVDAPIDEVRAKVLPAIATVHADIEGTVVRVATDDLEWLACYLMGLPWPFRVREPTELRRIVRRRAADIAARHRPSGQVPP